MPKTVNEYFPKIFENPILSLPRPNRPMYLNGYILWPIFIDLLLPFLYIYPSQGKVLSLD